MLKDPQRRRRTAVGTTAVLLLTVISFARLLGDVRFVNNNFAPTDAQGDATANAQSDAHANATAVLSQNSGVNSQNIGKSETSTNIRRPLSLIAYLRGEMANNLSILWKARLMQLVAAQKEFGLVLNIAVEHQDHKKWKKGYAAISRCFPALRNISFYGGKWMGAEYHKRAEEQRRWIGDKGNKRLKDMSHASQFRYLMQLLKAQQEAAETAAGSNSSSSSVPLQPANANISLPFLSASRFVRFQVIGSPYYLALREWLTMDEESCCDQLPAANETVFHLRNFLFELGEENAYKKGFVELSPSNVAEQLLGHLRPGDQVAIVSRFTTDGESSVEPYVEALTQRGLQIRVIEGQSGVQDFCFLKHAQKELVGSYWSTYTGLAAMLGNASVIRLYRVDSPWSSKKKPLGEEWEVQRVEPKSIFLFPKYRQEEKFSLEGKLN